jgi:hypothetical protein
MRCPACNGKRLNERKRYSQAMLYCDNCNTTFRPDDALPDVAAAPTPRVPRKSGVIAGPVFRRGFRWGAGY